MRKTIYKFDLSLLLCCASAFPSVTTLLKTYGMIAFQFDIHPMLMTIQVDMQDKQKISHAVIYGILRISSYI